MNSSKQVSHPIHMLHWTIDKSCSAQTRQTFTLERSSILWGYLTRTDQYACATLIFLSARAVSFVICMTKQVTLKKNGSFSYRIPLTAWEPPTLYRYRHQITAKCGRLYKVTYPTSSRLSPPAYGSQPQPYLLHAIYSVPWEALLNTALNRWSVVMPRSQGSMPARRENATGLSLQGSKSHRDQRQNWKLIQEGGNPMATKF